MFDTVMFYKEHLLQPVHGHRSSEAPSPFRQTRDGEIHFTEDPEINFASIAFNSYIPKTVGQTSVKGNLSHFIALLHVGLINIFYLTACAFIRSS